VEDLFQQKGTSDLADDARHLLRELDRDVPGVAAATADCRPPLDVFETASALEILVDVPGVLPESIRIAIRRSTLLIVGAKLPGGVDPSARFQVAERSFGRFARIVRLTGAFDLEHCRAVVAAGELRIVLPRLADRRGRVFRISVERG
jgi:HSP20 family protein